jgi:DNA-binding NarL/FixJ family response regulator
MPNKPPQNINVLIADDQNLIILGYKNIFSIYPSKKYTFTIYEAQDCKSGYEIIKNAPVKFDIAFLDISMPEYPEENIFSGEDLAKLLKQEMPQCKIVFLTMHQESLKAQKIIDEINPLGLIIKNDLDFETMKLAIETVLKNERYYSDAIIKHLNLMQKERIYVDIFDKRILFYLKKGINADDVALYIPISAAEVHSRIKKMKQTLGIENANDADFVEIAADKGMMI